MRYSLLNFVACPETKSELVCVVTREKAAGLGFAFLSDCERINQPGALVGPVPESAKRSPIADLLRQHACASAPASRNYEVRVEQGLLVAPDTGRWYPIREFIPELLPDHLRDLERDREFLASLRPSLPPELYELLAAQPFSNTRRRSRDAGLHHKSAEMSIAEKVDSPDFFGPGYVSPFNPGAGWHTAYLIRLFGFCLDLLGNGERKTIVDTGCGYAWTTEWLFRCGMEPVGVDITRTYLDIAAKRLGDQAPHMVVGDTENLPIRSDAMEAVLGFESFHHIPDRNRAMDEFFRVLKLNGIIVLAEPDNTHQEVQSVQDVMEKYGILEKGMDLHDVRKYARGTGLSAPVHNYVLKTDRDSLGATIDLQFVKEHAQTPAQLYTIHKRVAQPLLKHRIERMVAKVFD